MGGAGRLGGGTEGGGEKPPAGAGGRGRGEVGGRSGEAGGG